MVWDVHLILICVRVWSIQQNYQIGLNNQTNIFVGAMSQRNMFVAAHTTQKKSFLFFSTVSATSKSIECISNNHVILFHIET